MQVEILSGRGQNFHRALCAQLFLIIEPPPPPFSKILATPLTTDAITATPSSSMGQGENSGTSVFLIGTWTKIPGQSSSHSGTLGKYVLCSP